MKFVPLEIPGAFRVELERREDSRGFFARSWCEDEFRKQGLSPALTQCNVSYNREAGTLRGLHYHRSLRREAKLVRCARGAIFDVVVDLRRDSPAFGRWAGAELDEENRSALYVPEGCAHGFQTLRPDSEVLYQMSSSYEPEMGAGLLWSDRDLAVAWPDPGAPLLSEKDAALPRFREVFPAQA